MNRSEMVSRYNAALAVLDAKIGILHDVTAAGWLSRYLWGSDTTTNLYKLHTHYKPPEVRFNPPVQLWRLRSRLEAIETLEKLPQSLLVALMHGGIPLCPGGQRSTVTWHEKGDVINDDVRAFFRQAVD